MLCAIHLDKIAGSDFFEVLRSLISGCIPDGGTIVKVLADFSVLFLVLGILAGISQCFFGYKLRRLWTAILMIVLCGCAGGMLVAELGLPAAALVGITAGAAVAGGLLGYFLWIIGCFFRPFVVISILVFSVFVINDMHTPGLIIALAAGLIAGIVSAAFCKVCLILYTSVFGGLLTGMCITQLIRQDLWYLTFVIGVILAFAGVIVQMLANREARAALDTDGKEQVKAALKADGKELAQAALDAAGKEPPAEALGASAEKVYAQIDGIAEFAAAAESEGCEEAAQAAALGRAMTDTEAQNTTASISDAGSTGGGVCPACGAPHSARAKFCMQCGQKLPG